MARAAGSVIDLSGANRVVKELQRELAKSSSRIRKGANRAMKRTLRTGKSDISKHIRETINLKKKTVDERISTKVVSQRLITGRITVRDRRIELTAFMSSSSIARQYQRQVARKTKGIRVKVWKKKPPVRFEGVFLNIGKRSGRWHALQREGKSRYRLFIRYGPSIATEFEKVLPDFTRNADRVLQKNLDHEIARALRVG